MFSEVGGLVFLAEDLVTELVHLFLVGFVYFTSRVWGEKTPTACDDASMMIWNGVMVVCCVGGRPFGRRRSEKDVGFTDA